jgi:hypothetical protein
VPRYDIGVGFDVSLFESDLYDSLVLQSGANWAASIFHHLFSKQFYVTGHDCTGEGTEYTEEQVCNFISGKDVEHDRGSIIAFEQLDKIERYAWKTSPALFEANGDIKQSGAAYLNPIDPVCETVTDAPTTDDGGITVATVDTSSPTASVHNPKDSSYMTVLVWTSVIVGCVFVTVCVGILSNVGKTKPVNAAFGENKSLISKASIVHTQIRNV